MDGLTFLQIYGAEYSRMEKRIPELEGEVEELRAEAIVRNAVGDHHIDAAQALLSQVETERDRLREHETWLKLGHEAADGFLDMPSQSHIVDKVCIIGHERDELRGEIDQLRKLVGELRDILPIERLEEGGDPGWLADLKRRAAETVKGK